jgi:hypothetical protein
LRLLIAIALVAVVCVAQSPPRSARSQVPLAPVTGLEVIGELRPGTPNIPLLLVVQWDDVDGAESYELERAEPPPAGQERVYAPVATLTPDDRRPNGKIGYVDDAGFAGAGGDCFRVRAVRGDEVSEWAEECLQVPPSDGGAGLPGLFQFDIRFSHDFEFTIIQRVVPPGYEDEPFTLLKQRADGPVVVLPPLGHTGVQQIVLLQTGGCWWLEVDDVPPVEYRCVPLPTDLFGPKLPAQLLPLRAPVEVRLTGRREAPQAVVWRASGGSQDMRFRIDRVVDGVASTAASLSYAASELSGDVQVYLDPAPAEPLGCYRVSAVTGAIEVLLGEACLADSPGPPDVGSGTVGSKREGGTAWTLVGMLLLLMAGSLRARPAR